MPEIWLSYGPTDVVLDVKAENLEKQIEPGGTSLADSEIISKLAAVDMTKPTELVIMEYTKSVQKVISTLLEMCAQKSLAKPKILIDKSNLHLAKSVFSDPSISISEFDSSQLSNANLVFVGEMEFDGLFGYNTLSTKLLRRFGKESMLEAYEKRNGNLPLPGEELRTMEIAKRFTDGFDISAIEIVANQTGIVDISTGHPSSTAYVSKSLSSIAINEIDKHRIVVISTGKEASNETLSRSLSAIWNCSNAVKEEPGHQPVAHDPRLGSKLDTVELGRSLRPWSRLKSPRKFWQFPVFTSVAVQEVEGSEISRSLAAPPRKGSQCAPF